MKINMLTKAVVIVIAVGVIALLLQPSQSLHAQSPMTRSIQYKVVPTNVGSVTQQQLQSILDSAGKEGWDFISKYGTPQGDVFIFKR